jgi:hypothetical protein
MPLGFEPEAESRPYRSVNGIPRLQYTVAEDDFGWLWSVVLGSPPKIKSGHAVTKGTAILKVWAAIDRVLGLPKLTLVQSDRPET